MCAVEGLDDRLHAVVYTQYGRGFCHQLGDTEASEKFRAEDKMSYVIHAQDANQLHLSVHHGEDVPLARSHHVGYVAKCLVGI